MAGFIKNIFEFLQFLGRNLFESLGELYAVAKLVKETLYWTLVAPFIRIGIRYRSTVKQSVIAGVNSVPIVSMIAILVGIILALQTAYQLKKYGATDLVADLVAISITRELGPLMAAIIIAGQVGAANAAEIGSMKNNEEIDALELLALNPVHFLVVPKILALWIMMPCLAMIADLAGIAGGYIVGVFHLGIPSARYIFRTTEALYVKDILAGLMKAEAFACIIGFVSCYKGLSVEGGAEGVGRNTTSAVVTAIFCIILTDAIFTAFFNRADPQIDYILRSLGLM
ncbi:MlaE family ABC transporter permease [Candidatus Riflebacteria bacterium]